MQKNHVKTYCSYMEDVKSRLVAIKTVAGGQLSLGSDLFNYEFVSVQFRKSLELVAFASLIANKDTYARVHAKFANHWKAKDMISNLESLHTNFYPRPIRLGHVNEFGVKHFECIENGYLTKEDFVTLYDLCSEVLHTRNPFTQKNNHIDFKCSVAEWAQKIECLLKLHCMRFIDRQEIWMVDMECPKNGKVHVYMASPQ